MVTPDKILARLPPYLDKWQTIKRKQYVPDIITEIGNAHILFASYYDCFSDLFFTTRPVKLSEDVWKFCKRFITYDAETVDDQTSALPTGILEKRKGDCKHYALFCAGVIDSINRCYGTTFEWCYYFAAYDGEPEPYHVFVSLYDPVEHEEIWIDPTPGSSGEEPTLLMPVYIN